MSQLVHAGDVRSRLDEIEDEVFATVDRMCLRVGALLVEARSIEGDGFKAWVTERMPFGWETARRLLAIAIAYRDLPPERVEKLPRPWQAMYALAPFAQGQLVEALESGEVGPDMTTRQARDLARAWRSHHRRGRKLQSPLTAADRNASKLMEHAADDLSEAAFKSLERWLGRRSQ